MRKLYYAAVLVTVVFALALGPACAVKYVKWDAPGPDHNGTSWSKAFLTIQEALDVAADGERVLVAGTPGTLEGNSEPGAIYPEKIVFKTAVILEGGYRGKPGALPDLTRDRNVYITILDGGASAAAARTVTAKANSSIDGFTIRGAETAVYINTGVNTVFTVKNNIVQNGSAYGIYAVDCKPTITANTIDGRGTGTTGVRFEATAYCTSSYGSARCNSCAGQMSENRVLGWTDYATVCVGKYQGCYNNSCTAACTPTISDNDLSGGNETVYIRCCLPTITGNRITGEAGKLAAVSVSHCSPEISGNRIVANAASGIRCYSRSGCTGTYGSSWCETTNPTISDNLITDAGEHGIYCGADARANCYNNSCTPVCRPTIRGNYIADSPRGIGFGSGSGGTADGNWITKCDSAIACLGVAASVINNTLWDNHEEGILCNGGSAASITGNTIYGGPVGIRCAGTTATHTSPEVLRNSVIGSGIGALCQMSDSDVKSNLFAHCTESGVGIQGGSAKVYNNTIVKNTVYGINVESGTPQMFNNIVSGNDVGYLDVGETGTLGFNCFWQNTTADYYPISKPASDIAANPSFLDSNMGVFQLQPGSVCINAGDNTKVAAGDTDRDGEDRIQDTTVDMGSFEGSDDVITPVIRIAEAKGQAADVIARISGKAVSGAFADSFYIEEPDRSAGIRVFKPSHGVAQATLATVVGTVETNLDGERFVRASGVSGAGIASVTPVIAHLWSVGGEDQAELVAGGLFQQGVTGGEGLNNIGLLLTVAGRIVESGPTWLTLDDGSGVAVKCVAPTALTIDPAWTHAKVTGISSCQQFGGSIHRQILVRAQSDITGH